MMCVGLSTFSQLISVNTSSGFCLNDAPRLVSSRVSQLYSQTCIPCVCIFFFSERDFTVIAKTSCLLIKTNHIEI